ncbi:MAG TPA: SRPBCC domain-containing protein [Actinophytocola sp.]|uniref:SRPBCC family protein n=1 Tax=Actinophytocola sp. TaxID=1872138 RepID=UPI002DDCF102|nr:SRPBCC domain-containing protein [Actinophytocola sp.]HEV2778849.1 SRPBCC domain-containing protein [Actinophytocola sp.]
MSDDEEPFRVEVTIAAPVDAVWRAMREPELIRRWHGWDDPALDAEIDFIYRQQFTESAGDHTLSAPGGDTFTLHDAGDGRTLVRLVRAPRGTNPEWDAYYDDINEGWTTFLHQLRFSMERHLGVDRRTVFLEGAVGEAGTPIDALGLAAVASLEPGSRYTTELAGEPVAGEVWFRSANQLGLTVDGWNDGLVIIGAAPASPARPRGGAMAVLSTYGLDDASFDALQNRWRPWWSERFAASEAKADA